jgi:DNA replication protein DnaC
MFRAVLIVFQALSTAQVEVHILSAQKNNSVRSKYSIRAEKQIAILDLAYSVTCLVLDDLGVEQSTSAAIRQFYELIEERRGTNGLYTVITSNLSIDELEERWRPEGVALGEFHEGSRVTDRLRESWGDLEIQGISIRAANRETYGGIVNLRH